MKFIKKHWFIISIVIITIIRFTVSFWIVNFYNRGLYYDDRLMVQEATNILSGNYLGIYSDLLLIKGIIYPLIMSLSIKIGLRLTVFLTLLYILASLYFINSFRKVTNNKFVLLCTYVLIVANPLSYASETFQRLYLTSLSLIELLFFIGTIINIIYSKKNSLINYISLGFILCIMILTRDDAVWAVVVTLIVFICKLYKNINANSIVKCMLSIAILFLGINIVRFVNYKYYGVFTYSEINDSYFSKAYSMLIKVKDDEKIDRVSITKSSLLKVANNTDMLFNKEEIEDFYDRYKQYGKEIDNGNMKWFLRRHLYKKYLFKSGKEANDYYKKLYYELKRLFKEKKLESDFLIPIVNIEIPSINEIKEYPKSIIEAIIYSSSYKNVRTFSEEDIVKLNNADYDTSVKAYRFGYKDYRNQENAIVENDLNYEIIRMMYMSFTILFSIISLIIYFYNMKKKDKLSMLTHIIFISYLIILFGVMYVHVTSFPSIRYRYLCNIYILQSIFIVLNIERFRINKNTFKKN